VTYGDGGDGGDDGVVDNNNALTTMASALQMESRLESALAAVRDHSTCDLLRSVT
jgi:hypothetical protein